MITWENKQSWSSPWTRRKSRYHRLRKSNGCPFNSNTRKRVLTIDQISERMMIAENGSSYLVTRARKDPSGCFHLELINTSSEMPRIIVTDDSTRQFKTL